MRKLRSHACILHARAEGRGAVGGFLYSIRLRRATNIDVGASRGICGSPFPPLPLLMLDSHLSGGIMQKSAALPATSTRVWSIAERLPALAVLMFGLVVLYAAGFSTFARAHNAAHDARHANGFPCH